MKKIIYYIAIVASSLAFSSCNDFLETSSDSKMTEETIFKSPYYTESAVLGLYDRIADAQMYAQRVSLNWSTNNDIEFVGADEKSYNQNSNRGVSNYYASADNSVLIWTRIYQLIERANLVVAGIEQSPLMSSDNSEQALMKSLLAEAKTLRAMAAFELIKHWGDVPFKTEPTKNDLSNVYLPKTDRDSIAEFLINDLLEAQKDIPWIGGTAGSKTYSTAERVNKGFVKGLIARIALIRGGYSLRDKAGFPTERGSDWQKYYEIAREQCKDVIDQGVYRLKPNYLNVWRDVCALKADGVNGENLYEVALGVGQSGEIGYSIGVRFYTNSKYGYGNNSNVVNTSAYYFYSFDQADTRRDATVATATYSNSAGDLREGFISNPLSYNFAKWDQRWMSEDARWLSYNKGANNKWGYGVNWIVMRYSDILLMFAETENELNGPTGLAKDALKQVRARAFANAKNSSDLVTKYVDDLSSKDAFFNAIVNERAWEFGGEGIRKFDLVRWNLLMPKIQEQRDAITNMIDGKPAVIFGTTYTSLPQNIFYRYDEEKENIVKSEINYYTTAEDLEAMTDAELKTKGYTKVKWMTNFSDDNKKAYKERVKLFSSGLSIANNKACDNRYLFPIHTVVIGDYQGLISNSYGY